MTDAQFKLELLTDANPIRIPRKALPFIVLSDHRSSPHLRDGAGLMARD
jgi:hypothetical protein